MPSWYSVVPTPIDELLLVTDGLALTHVWFSPFVIPAASQRAHDAAWVRDDAHPVLKQAARQLAEYFGRERQAFDLPLAPNGSAFQRRVWSALRRIPFGQTRSYGQVAAELDLGPAASRAVGLANGSNPLPVVIPCHRVIGANGSLTGFGGGLPRKRYLLDLETDALF